MGNPAKNDVYNFDSVDSLKDVLGINDLDTKGLKLPKSFSLTQEELKKMKEDFQKMGDTDKVAKLQEIIAAKQAIHTEAKAERGEYSLEKIRKEIKEKGMSFSLTKEFLEHLDEIKLENKPFVLGGIFSGLNQIGISILGVNGDGKIQLKEGKQDFKKGLKIANTEDVVRYNELLNNYINSGKITIFDINRGLLYRTTSVDDYIEEKVEGQKLSTSEYTERLMKKYKITVKGDLKNLQFGNEQDLEFFKANISQAITDNQADKEFLFAYFDDMYYRESKGISEDAVSNYKQTSDKNEKEITKSINTLNDNQKFALGVRDGNDAKQIANEATKDPLGFIKKNLNSENILLALVVGIVGAVIGSLTGIGGGKGFLLGGVLGLGLGAGGGAFAEEAMRKFGDKKDSEDEKGSTETNKTSVFEKYKNKLVAENEGKLDDGKLLLVWDELSKNEEFLGAKASTLNIFETQKDEASLKSELKKLGIELTEKNKEYYQYIFGELLLSRQRQGVGEPVKGESIKSYLEKTSKTDSGDVTGKEQLGIKSTEITQELSENEKRELFNYFDIKENEVKDLISNLDILGLNLFQLLAGYKNFIETKLSGLDEGIKSKIKQSIKIKVGLINGKIDELKTKEMKDNKTLDGFKNNRWIVNAEIKAIFEKINFLVLPSAYVLVQSQKISQAKNEYEKKKMKEIEDMLNSNLASDGDFDKFSLLELWDSTKDNWSVFNITDENDLKYLKETWGFDGGEILNINLLNEKDKEIEEKAMMWYMAGCAVLIANAGASFTGVWTIPGMVIGSGYSAIDAFKSEDLLVSILKSTYAIPEEYRTDKKWIDNILAGIGAIPLLGPAIKAIPLSSKVAGFVSKLSPEKLAKFEAMKAEMFEKLAEKLPKIFKSGETVIDKTTNFGVSKNIVDSLNVGENITQRVTVNGEILTLTLRKGDSGLKLYEVIKADGTVIKGTDLLSIDLSKAKVVEDAVKVGILASLSQKTSGIFENKFIGKVIDELEEGKNIEMGGVTFTKTNGRYIGTINGVKSELTKKQFLEHIEKLPVEEKQKFIASIKETKVLLSEKGKVRTISGHEVRITEKGWEVRKTKDGKILQGDELKEFINNNLDKLSKEFKGMSISEGGVKIKEGIISGYEKYGIKTVWDYLEKAGYKDGDRSKFFGKGSKKLDFLGGIVLTPATTIRQLISAIPNGEWENIFRILISGNKNMKIWGGIEKSSGVGNFFSKLAFDSGIVRAGVIGGVITEYDEIIGDQNNGKMDEIGDYAFYRYGGIVDTILAKYLSN